MAIPKGYYTPQELIEKYPDVARNFRLDATKIGQLLDLGYLLGFFDPSTKRNYIYEPSFKLSVKFKNDLIELSTVQLKNRQSDDK